MKNETDPGFKCVQDPLQPNSMLNFMHQISLLLEVLQPKAVCEIDQVGSECLKEKVQASGCTYICSASLDSVSLIDVDVVFIRGDQAYEAILKELEIIFLSHSPFVLVQNADVSHKRMRRLLEKFQDDDYLGFTRDLKDAGGAYCAIKEFIEKNKDKEFSYFEIQAFSCLGFLCEKSVLSDEQRSWLEQFESNVKLMNPLLVNLELSRFELIGNMMNLNEKLTDLGKRENGECFERRAAAKLAVENETSEGQYAEGSSLSVIRKIKRKLPRTRKIKRRVKSLYSNARLIRRLSGEKVKYNTDVNAEYLSATRNALSEARLREVFRGVDVVSFDVFDTLLLREVYQPTDAFELIGRILGVEEFKEIRVQAEAEARKKYSQYEDVTYEEIYEFLPGIDPSVEQGIEQELCIVNPEIFKVYQLARRESKRVIAISDMYLGPAVIESLLSANGIQVDKLYVSSAHRKSKGRQTLFRLALDDLGIEPASLFHIGDNHVSDYLSPKKMGIKAYFYPKKSKQGEILGNPSLFQALSSGQICESLYMSALVNNIEDRKNKSYWFNFGFEYSGILLYHFVVAVHRYCLENNLTRVYFMARDGEIIKRIFDRLYGNEGFETHYLLVSRRALLLPAINELDEFFLEKLTESPEGAYSYEIVDRLSIPKLTQLARVELANYKVTRMVERNPIKNFMLRHKSILLEAARNEKDNLMGYLSQQGLLGEDDALLIDIGWASSSQRYLEMITGKRYHGFYYGTHPKSYKHENVVGYFFNQGYPKKKHQLSLVCLEILELLACGKHDSVVRFSDKFRPEYQLCGEYEEERKHIAAYIHEGVIEFVEKYQYLLKKYNVEFVGGFDEKVLEALLLCPSPSDVENISAVPHASGLGDSSYRPIIKNLNSVRMDERDFWNHGKVYYHAVTGSSYFEKISEQIRNTLNLYNKRKDC